jgi:hypothetical protein
MRSWNRAANLAVLRLRPVTGRKLEISRGDELMQAGSSKPSAFVFGVTVLVLALACRREEITHAKIPKGEPGLVLAQGRDPAMPAGGAGNEVPPPPTPTGANALKWTLPKGWAQTMSGGMRYATLKPSVSGRIEASVVVLPGPAGGELANVNRWRGQIGLEPVDESALGASRKTFNTKAGTVSVFDFQSEGQNKSRVIAGLTVSQGNTWFVKMTGDADPVAAARADFIHLLESLRFEDAK